MQERTQVVAASVTGSVMGSMLMVLSSLSLRGHGCIIGGMLFVVCLTAGQFVGGNILQSVPYRMQDVITLPILFGCISGWGFALIFTEVQRDFDGILFGLAFNAGVVGCVTKHRYDALKSNPLKR